MWICSRSWAAERKCSRRSSIHLTGRRRRRASQQTSASSGIEARLGPEAAADVRRRDHAHAVLGQVEEVGEHGADGVRRLGGVPDGERVQRLVVARDEAAALHRVAAAAHHAEGLAQRVVGRGEGPLGLAHALDDVGGDVVAQLVVDQRGAGRERGRRGGDDGQGVVLDLDEIARVLGERARLGHHGRDHLADVANLRDGQRVAHAVADGGARHGARHAGRPGLLDVGDVGGRHHRQHAGQRQRGGDVDAPHAGVGVGAPHHGGVRHARHLEVVDEGAAPGQQARVLPPRDRRADVAAFGRASGGASCGGPCAASLLHRGEPRPLREEESRRTWACSAVDCSYRPNVAEGRRKPCPPFPWTSPLAPCC